MTEAFKVKIGINPISWSNDNLPSLGGTYGFDIAKNRAVAVDARAIVYALDAIYGARALSAELTGKTQQ